MNYFSILDPDCLEVIESEEIEHIYLDWREVCNNIEDSDNYLYSLLINVPVLMENGELAEKTVLVAFRTAEETFDSSPIQIRLSDELSICSGYDQTVDL